MFAEAGDCDVVATGSGAHSISRRPSALWSGPLDAVRTKKPDQSEYLPFYGRYIDHVASGDVVATLATQMEETQKLLRGLPANIGTHRYASGKWSVNEVIGHVADAERIFAARALRFARNDPQPLPGFEQDDYVANSTFNVYPVSELALELATVRQSTIYLFRHLDEAAWMRRGVASGADVSVRALAYIIAGHELHHRQVLQTKYL
jgi:hypothetical protein